MTPNQPLTDSQKLDALYRRFILGETNISAAPPAQNPFGDGGNAARPEPVARELLPILEIPGDAPVEYQQRGIPNLPQKIAIRAFLAKEVAGWESKGTALANTLDQNVVLPHEAMPLLRSYVQHFENALIGFPFAEAASYADQISVQYGEFFKRAIERYWDGIALGLESPFDRSRRPSPGYAAPNGMPLNELFQRGNAL